MNDYPEAVRQIADDHLERVKSQLALVPARERDEFLREIQSHVHEAYWQEPGSDDVAKILDVLRRLGEPAEVVSDRLPESIVRSGTRRNVPLYVLGGILTALFGIPLGIGGVAVLVGILATLAAVVATYYLATGTILLVAVMFMSMGLTRIFLPELWDKLVSLGIIQMNGRLADFIEQWSFAEQGLILVVFASVFGASGVGMLRLGRRMLRGLRFLLNLLFDWLRRWAADVRRMIRQDRHADRGKRRTTGWRSKASPTRFV